MKKIISIRVLLIALMTCLTFVIPMAVSATTQVCHVYQDGHTNLILSTVANTQIFDNGIVQPPAVTCVDTDDLIGK